MSTVCIMWWFEPEVLSKPGVVEHLFLSWWLRWRSGAVILEEGHQQKALRGQSLTFFQFKFSGFLFMVKM